MREILIQKLQHYISENNPELLLQLEEEETLQVYLSNKVSCVDDLLKQSGNKEPFYILEISCMDILTQDLRPSRFNYINGILEEEFELVHQQMKDSGTLQFEIINLIQYCREAFDEIGFTERNENNWQLHYLITGAISEYLEKNVR